MSSPDLDDPDYAAFAWRRFRRILGWMALAAATSAGGSLYLVEHFFGALSWIATGALLAGVFFTVLMAGALMGLAFLSSGSGHDEAVRAFDPDA
ncbi:MAG: hypothetical protein V4659_12130 [Pseudomonadota bacterium]